MRRVTLEIAALAVAGAACMIGLLGPAGPAGANQETTNVYCKVIHGTTSGTVSLTSCRARQPGPHAPNPGSGTIPGATLVGTSTGTVTWTAGANSYSTTISVTTTRAPEAAQAFCFRKHSVRYDVLGTVTANNHPDIAVGDGVYSSLCINSAGVVKQPHYGSFLF
jgi:hypothetical protein